MTLLPSYNVRYPKLVAAYRFFLYNVEEIFIQTAKAVHWTAIKLDEHLANTDLVLTFGVFIAIITIIVLITY